jgi:large subunit ribosomal protein L4
MAKGRLYSSEGVYQSDIDLPDRYFDQPVKPELIHFYITAYSSNQRQGTSKTKSRIEVSGGGKKPWRQKGTGRARAGTNTSPIWVRGSKAHGAKPRSYSLKINKKAKRQALASALSSKAIDNSIHVFENLNLSAPKTKELDAILIKAELKSKKNLILVNEPQPNLLLATRNIPATRVGRLQDLNTYEVINANNLIFTKEALELLSKDKGSV